MCGIVGIVDHNARVRTDQIVAMCRAIEHRGPDDHGVHIAHDEACSVGFGSQRLSILDLSPAGHMPMANVAGDVVVAYNGEIYNHGELRTDLQRRGYPYRSRTDTETVLHAYEAYGVECFAKFNGMFAVAIHDRRQQQIVIARDRTGIKPVYYRWNGHQLIFASELKALLALPQIERCIDRAALSAYLSLGYVPAPHCLIAGVQRLPAGHYLVIKHGQLETRAFWSAGHAVPHPDDRSDADLIDQTRDAVEQAVQRQLMSDVPVGVLLSGGLDSTIVTAIAQQYHHQPLDTFSVGFDMQRIDAAVDADYNADRRYAALVAERLGTHHHEVIVNEDLDLADLLRDLIRSLDEPVWEASFVSIFLLCRLARQHGVKVVLTGDGSDELFAGYSWYRGAQRVLQYDRVPFLGAALPLLEGVFRDRPLGAKALDLRRKWRAPSLSRYRANYDHFGAAEKARLLGDGSDQTSDPVDHLIGPILERAGGSLVEQFAYADLALWVGEHFNQRIDRMSMACSVEARVPFQDNAVVDLALSVAGRRKMRGTEQKYLLRRAFADVVPPEVLNRPKRPFAAPQHAWFRDGLRPLVEDVLDPDRLAATNLLDPQAVQQVCADYLSGRVVSSQQLSILVMLQLWCEDVLQPAAI